MSINCINIPSFSFSLSIKSDLSAFRQLVGKALEERGQKLSDKSVIYRHNKKEKLLEQIADPKNLKAGEEILIYDESLVEKSLFEILNKLKLFIYGPIFVALHLKKVSALETIISLNDKRHSDMREAIAVYIGFPEFVVFNDFKDI